MPARRSVKKLRLRPHIVGVIASLADLRTATRMPQPPDLFELRLDHLSAFADQLEKKLSILPAPLIITARDPREGGANNLSIKQRRELLSRFLPYAQFVDIELRSARAFRSLLNLARRKNVRRIISFHDLDSTPVTRSLCAKAHAAKSCCADIFKVATRTDTPAQIERLLDFVANEDVDLATGRVRPNGGLAVSAMGIGRLGAISRLILARCGSVLNYAPLGRSKVEGQLSIQQLRSALAR